MQMMLKLLVCTFSLFSVCEAACPDKQVNVNETSFLIFSRGPHDHCVTTFGGATGNLYVTLILHGFVHGDSVSLQNNNGTANYSIITKDTFPDETAVLAVGFMSKTSETQLLIDTGSDLTVELVMITFSVQTCIFPINSPEITPPAYQPGVGDTMNCTVPFDGSMQEPSMTFSTFKMYGNDSLVVDDDEPLTGTDLPSDVFVNKSVQFTLSPSLGSDFLATLAFPTPDCSQIYDVNSSLLVSSPVDSQSQSYPPNLDCRIILKSSDDASPLMVNFTSLSLAPDADSILIKDGGASRTAPTVALLHSHSEPGQPILSSGSEMWIKFSTDEAGSAKGFTFDVKPLCSGGRYDIVRPKNVSLSPCSNDSAYFLFQVPELNQVLLEPHAIGATQLPAGVIKCYEGGDNSGRILAYYRTDYLYYPVLSSASQMFCINSNGNPALDHLTAQLSAVTSGLVKFSSGSADQYALNLPLNGVMSTWTILPMDEADQPITNSSSIQFVITKLEIPDGADVNITLSTLKNSPIATLSADISIPFASSSYASRGLQLIISSATSSDKSPPELYIEASYQLASYSIVESSSPGLITSPWYPQGIPFGTNFTWMLEVPPNKSLALTSDGRFGLGADDVLLITTLGRNQTADDSEIVARFTGLTEQPQDIIINNAENSSLTVQLNLQSSTLESSPLHPGFQFAHTLFDVGNSVNVTAPTQELTTPNYPYSLNSSLTMVYIYDWPKYDSKGKLNLVKAKLEFVPNNSTGLVLRDGDHSNSPILVPDELAAASSSATFETSGSSIFVQYNFTRTQTGNTSTTGAPFKLELSSLQCDKQCQSQQNETVCIPAAWVCDAVYQCLGGEDELGCSPNPPSGSSSKGIKRWVVGVSVVAAFLGGIIFLIVVLVIVARRRGQGYSQLRDMMAPVPT